MNEWGSLLFGDARRLFENLLHEVNLGPYIAAVAFVFFGLFVGKLVYVILVAILDLVRFDKLGEKIGLHELVESRFNDSPSRLFGRVAYWLVLAFFLAAAINVLEIVDVAQIVEGFVGMLGRIFSFLIILLLADLIGRFAGAAVNMMLALVDHPASEIAARPVHLAILAGAGITNLDVLGVNLHTSEGVIVIGFGSIIALVAGCAFTIIAIRRQQQARRLAERFRIGDRITLDDGGLAVVRQIEADHLVVSSGADEWLLPAGWVLGRAVRKQEL